MLGAVLWRHSGDLHGLEHSLDDLAALLEDANIAIKLITIVGRDGEAHRHDQVVNAALEREDFLGDSRVGALEAVEFGLFRALDLVVDQFGEEGQAVVHGLLGVVRHDGGREGLEMLLGCVVAGCWVCLNHKLLLTDC